MNDIVERLLEIQGRFVAADFRPAVFWPRRSRRGLFRQLLGSRIRPTLNSFLDAIRQRIVRRLRPMRPSAFLDESCLPRCQQGGAGSVDDVLLGSNGSAVTVGWAADMLIKQPAKAVHVFLNGHWVGMDSPWQSRPDVAAHFDDGRLNSLVSR